MDIKEHNKYIPYRKTNDDTVSNLFMKMLNSYGIKEKFFAYRARCIWHEAMGQTISNHTQEIFVKRKKLYIKIRSASLKNEISFSKDKVIQIINNELNEPFIESVILL